MIRNRKEDYADEEIEFHKHEENKPYPYFVVIKSLFYAFLSSVFVALFFIFFILQSDKEQISKSLNSHFQELTAQNQDIINNNNNNNSESISNSDITINTKINKNDNNNENIISLSSLSTSHEKIQHEIHPDKCSNEWTNDKLVGRCFGLKSHREYEQLKDVHLVDSSQHCRQLCCSLGNECLTWQYWIDEKICKLGGVVRYGTEAYDTPNWCDSEPPVTWFGRRIEIKKGVKNEVGPILTTQCFGLGPLKTSNDGKTSLSKDECLNSCLQTDCNIWQWNEKRGCYYTSNLQVYCDPYVGGYDGGRKIIQRN